MCQLTLSNEDPTSLNSNGITPWQDGNITPLPFYRTVSLRLLVVPPAFHSYGFVAIKLHLSSVRPVRVFPLARKPRWFHTAGGRGKASSIKTGQESDDMGYNGFKISLCCKNIRMSFALFMGVTRHWENLCLSPHHSSCSHVAVVFEGSGASVLFSVWLYVWACVLAATIACCIGFFQWPWQRGNCTKGAVKSSVFLWLCSLPASTDWCHNSGTLWAWGKWFLSLFFFFFSRQVNNFAKCHPSSSIARHSEFYTASNSCTTKTQVGWACEVKRIQSSLVKHGDYRGVLYYTSAAKLLASLIMPLKMTLI